MVVGFIRGFWKGESLTKERAMMVFRPAAAMAGGQTGGLDGGTLR